MRLLPQPSGAVMLRLDVDEAQLLSQLTGQLIDLLRSHSGTDLDPDPLFAQLEVGGTDEPPDDPALKRLFPDAYESEDDASEYRRVTEQGLLNRKLHDAIEVSGAIGLGASPPTEDDERTIVIEIDQHSLPGWARTLTALRLAIAARIGLESEDDHTALKHGESTRGTVLVYDWLAAILDSLLRVVGSQSDDD